MLAASTCQGPWHWLPYKMVLQLCNLARADGHVKLMTISVSCRRHRLPWHDQGSDCQRDSRSM